MWRTLLLAFVFGIATAQAEIPEGDGRTQMSARGVSVEAFTYRAPGTPATAPFLIVLHGLERDAESYRDSAKPLAEALGAIAIVPQFDRDRFPTASFQRAGIVVGGKLRPREQWLSEIFLAMIDALRVREGDRARPVRFIGHSAGAQFLSRLSAFGEPDALRIVIANPSSLVFPTVERPFPYGFGGPTEELGDEDALRRYLALPITVYLGEADLLSRNRDDSPPAVAQGETRFARGQNFFAAGKELAEAQGWPFEWRLVTAPGIGHSARAMFAAPQALEALR